ncbi:hypothetical protein FJZ31_08050 [Candidatus Poribacteria bacterium]|nr:hypothetical protein [Candidatus Poribacteria bacterium]
MKMKKNQTKFSLLLKTGLYSFSNSVRHGGEARRKWIGQIVGFSVMVFALFFAANAAFRFAEKLLGKEFELQLLSFISLFMSFGMVMLLRDGMEISMRILYEKEDIPLLISSPITPATVFGYKLLQIITSNLWGLAIWLLPPWIALARIFHPSWPFYVLLLPTLFLFLVILVTIIATIIMIIIRFFSSPKVMLIVKIITGTAGFLVGLGFALFFIWGIGNIQSVVNFLAKVQMPIVGWYPHAWVGYFLSSFLPGVDVSPSCWGLLLLAASIGLPAIAIFLATRIYYRSWELLQTAQATPRRRAKVKAASAKSITRGRMRAIIVKDFRMLMHNRQQIMMMVMLSAIMLLIILGVISKSDEAPKDIMDTIMPLMFIVIFYSLIISLGMTWGAFKNEGDAWWILQSSPISHATLYKAKLIPGLAIAILYTEFWMSFALLLLRPLTKISFIVICAAGVFTASLVAINLSIGSLPWMAEVGQWKTSRNPTARIATYILSMIFDLVVFIVPTVILFLAWEHKDLPFFSQFPRYVAKFTAIVVVLLFFFGIFITSYVIGKRNLSRLIV